MGRCFELDKQKKIGKVSYDLGIGPFFGSDLDTGKSIKEWSYGAWVFCVVNEIIR